LNALNGSANFHLFSLLREGKSAVRVVSLSISEVETRGLRPADGPVGTVIAAYFQTVDTPASREFARKIRDRYGPGAVVSDMTAAAYEGVHLWAKAVEKAGTTDPGPVAAAARGLEFDGPRGRVMIDPDTQYTWLPVRVGRVRADGLIDLVPGLGSDTSVRPEPFPPTRTPTEWNGFLTGLKGKWVGNWEAPPQGRK
jgi:urea transport system substrate-binding protein